MAYAVKRTHPSGSDFLHAWCSEWGTACMGSPSLAMIFATEDAANEAAAQAQRVCRGHGRRPAVGIAFSAVQI